MSVITINDRKKKKTSPILFFILILGIAFIGTGVWYLTKPKSSTKDTETPKQNQKITICIENDIPQEIADYITQYKKDGVNITYKTGSDTTCNTIVSRNTQTTDSKIIWSKVYLPVVRFDNKTENITAKELQDNIENGKYIWSTDTSSMLKSKYTLGVGYEEYNPEKIKENNSTFAIIPFDELTSIEKVIAVDGQTPLSKDFNKLTYPLTDIYYISNNAIPELTKYITEKLGIENYDVTLLTDVIITGTTTAGARTHFRILDTTKDPAFPIRPVADILKAANIAHVSNEISFWPDCYQEEQTLVFCGLPNSMEMLKLGGIDIVGLTGNHLMDYGYNAFKYTLDLYKENNMTYFGGGLNETEAHTPKIVEANGMKFAFLGYNFIPPSTYYAVGNKAGNATTDFATMKKDIEKAKTMADFVLVDMQWGNEYQHWPIAHQIDYGNAAVKYGADIVTGVHPHWVEGINYSEDGIVFYGLGNFLFDQLWSNETREGTMVQHFFYNKKYLGFKLIPTRIANNLQVELAEPNIKDRILTNIFDNSEINLTTQ